MGQAAAEPFNDNLSFAANSLDFLSGSRDLISIRGKGNSLRPFTVVRAMEADAAEKYKEKLTALEARINEVQGKLAELQGKKTEGGKLLASPEATRAIEEFQKQAAALRGERRGIRLALREGIDALENSLLAINLLAPRCSSACSASGSTGAAGGRSRRASRPAMKLRTLVISVAVLAALSVAAYLGNRPEPAPSAIPRGQAAPRPRHGGEAAGLTCLRPGQEGRARRDADGRGAWSYFDMPADFEKIARFVQDLNEAKVDRFVTANPERLAHLEFKDSSIALDDSAGKEIWSVTLGKTPDSGQRALHPLRQRAQGVLLRACTSGSTRTPRDGPTPSSSASSPRTSRRSRSRSTGARRWSLAARRRTRPGPRPKPPRARRSSGPGGVGPELAHFAPVHGHG
jgi:hypothetical protein